MTNCPLGLKNPDCGRNGCARFFAKDDGTGYYLCDYPYIGADKCEVKKGQIEGR